MPFPYDFPIDWVGESSDGVPLMEIEVSFATNPMDEPAWTGLEAYLRAMGTSRGRQHELDRVEAGTADLTLDNRDRRFDPLYLAGPYYPNLRPMKRIAIKATWKAVTYYLFEGFVEEWPPTFPQIVDAVVNIGAVDGFKVLNLDKITASYAQERSDVRMGRILDKVDWPSGDRVLSIGQSEVIASNLDDVNPLEHIGDVVEAENGLFYMDGQSRAVFRDRHYRLLHQDVSLATFGDGAGELPYHDIGFSFDDSEIWNRVEVTREGGTTQVAQNLTSQGRYFRRVKEREGQLITNDNEAANAAGWLLGLYREPAMRVTELLIKPQIDKDALYPQVLGRQIGDRITIKKRPPGGGTLSFDCHIESIWHRYSPEYWETTWRLSPASKHAYWVLGSATLSLLGETTKLGY